MHMMSAMMEAMAANITATDTPTLSQITLEALGGTSPVVAAEVCGEGGSELAFSVAFPMATSSVVESSVEFSVLAGLVSSKGVVVIVVDSAVALVAESHC